TDGFYQVTQVHQRVKVYNKEGFDWATVEVPLRNNGSKKERLNNLKAFTYNLENGKVKSTKLKSEGKFEERINSYWVNEKFTMPNISEGSVIEYEYTISSPYISIDDVALQSTVPIKELDVSIAIPE